MAKGDMGTILLIGVFAFFLFIQQQTPAVPASGTTNQYVPPATNTNSGGNNVINLVDQTTTSFYIYDKYAPTTRLSAQNATVYSSNGGLTKLGIVADGGSITVSPKDVLTIEWGTTDEAPGTAYYGYVQTETVPAEKGQLNLQGQLVSVSTAPTFTWFDENDAANTALTIDANDKYLSSIKLKSEADKGFGNSAAPRDNAVCFRYNTTEFNDIKLQDAPTISRPESITNISTGFTHKCYEYPRVVDTGSATKTVTLEASGTAPDAQSKSVEVCFDDIAMYKNADTDKLEWGYTDEDNVRLGSAPICNSIDVA